MVVEYNARHTWFKNKRTDVVLSESTINHITRTHCLPGQLWYKWILSPDESVYMVCSPGGYPLIITGHVIFRVVFCVHIHKHTHRQKEMSLIHPSAEKYKRGFTTFCFGLFTWVSIGSNWDSYIMPFLLYRLNYHNQANTRFGWTGCC